MRILPNFNNCLGLKTQNNETIIVDCKEKSVEATEEDTKGISNSTDANPKRNTKQNKEENISRSVKNSSGCYKMIKPDGTEGTVCQKLDRAKGCEIISTPSSLYVEVFCYPLEKLGNTIFLKKLKASKTHKERDGEDLHLIEPKPGQCFKIHTKSQPHLYQNPRRPEYADLFESCTNWLRENKNCLGLRTQNNEVLVIFCRGDLKRRRPGCYKIINRDKREEVICQKVNKQEGCEVVTTRTNLTVVVYCNSRTGTSSGVVDVKDNKPKRE
ncbi:hypothetical protein NQ318_003388 [Aromia moschata]|uniref:Uncharacterized protein n=1 Tax=Aromia moschata TaxID=1265417 RepID=A0AAV8XPS8_9CUCU|nr:hypothetical protein NQ318_003388 [Aromia moschata]